MEISYEIVYLQGGNKENEDAYAINENQLIFAAIDGATGLGAISGKIAAQQVKESLDELKTEECLVDALQQANSKIGLHVLKEANVEDFEEIPKESRSSCGIAAVKIKDNSMEYVHAGDCMIFIEYTNKEIRSLTYDHLAKLDAVSIALFRRAIASKITSAEDLESLDDDKISALLADARLEALPTIIHHRRKLNTNGGYGIIDGSKEALNYLDYGKISLQDATQILLVSDGLQLPTNKAAGSLPWELTAKFAFEHGLEALKNEVIRLENADKACFLYPRLKFADDKTGILLRLQ